MSQTWRKLPRNHRKKLHNTTNGTLNFRPQSVTLSGIAEKPVSYRSLHITIPPNFIPFREGYLHCTKDPSLRRSPFAAVLSLVKAFCATLQNWSGDRVCTTEKVHQMSVNAAGHHIIWLKIDIAVGSEGDDRGDDVSKTSEPFINGVPHDVGRIGITLSTEMYRYRCAILTHVYLEL